MRAYLANEFVYFMESIELQNSLMVHLMFHVLQSLGAASLLHVGHLLSEIEVHAQLLQLLLLLIQLLFLYNI